MSEPSSSPPAPAPARAPAPAAPASPEATPATADALALLVEDGALVPPGGQSKQAFLADLHLELDRVARQELRGSGLEDRPCPWIPYYTAWFASQPVDRGRRMIQLYIGTGQPLPADLVGLRAAIAARVRTSVAEWRASGRLPTLPPVLPGDAPAAMVVQRKAESSSPPPADAASVRARLGPGRALPGPERSRMERGLGRALPSVRIHTDERAERLAREVGARAFTVGADVAFRAGTYQPGTLAGDALLAHELAHVAQQGASGPAASGQQAGQAEQAADHAAARALGRIHGVELPAPELAPTGGLRLQRCKDSVPAPGGPPPITDPFAAELQALLDRSPPDKAGFFRRLVDQAGAKAGDAPLRDALARFHGEGKLSLGEAFRARLVQELGPDGHSHTTRWPTAVRNFADGVDDGVYTLALADVPASAEGIRQLCIERATTAAHGTDLLSTYRARFNARWDHPGFQNPGSPRYADRSTEFDPSLSSKGPKNRRARAIFNELYADAAIRAAYDSDSPAGFRELCDTYAVPSGLNLEASPRLQALLAVLGGAALSPAPTAISDASYTALLGLLAPAIAGLDSDDQDQIRQQATHWRAVYERKLGTTDLAIVSHLQDQVLGGSPAAPRARNPLSLAPAPVAPTPPGGTPTTPGTPAPPTPAEQAFLRGIRITPPSGPIDVEADREPLLFPVHAAVPNPSLTVERRVEVSPSAQVRDGTHEGQVPWAVGVQDLDHIAVVNPETTAASGETRFTATLTMPPYSPAHFAARTTAPVVVRDKRKNMFRRDVQKGLFFFYTEEHGLSSVGTPTYLGGQLPLKVQPYLAGGTPNPGLTVWVRGEVQTGGSTVPGGSFAEVQWRPGIAFAELGRVNLVQTSSTPSGQDSYTLRLEYLDGPGGAVFHTQGPTTFKVKRDVLRTTPSANDALQLSADRTALRTAPSSSPPSDPANPPTLRDYLKYPPPTLNAAQRANCKNVEAAIAAGRVVIDSMIVRSDSAHLIATMGAAIGVTTHQHVVYALGSMVISPSTALAVLPGYIGWHPHGSSTIFLNLTPDTGNPGRQRPISELAELAAHEAVHAMDPMPTGAGHTPWHDYTAEFRAYWTDGRFDAESTEPDASITWGPPSPRANAIFQMIYYGYEHTRTAYESDAAFRQRVDQYLYPDALNLPVSVHLDDLRIEIANHAPAYATRKANVQAKYNACTPAEKDEVHRQRAWRDLVEQHYTGTVALPSGGSEPEAVQIKRLLGIPL